VRLSLLYHQFIRRGGLEGYLWEFASQLEARGHELELVGSKIDGRFASLAAKTHLIKPPPFLSSWMLKRFAARSAEMVSRLNVDAVLGFGRTWKQDIHRAGGGCHAVYSRMLPERKRRGSKNQWELQLERKLYTSGETKHFVVNSSRIREELQDEYAVSADRITVIHTGVDTSHFKPAGHSVSNEAPTLLFASLDHRRKGLGALLEALLRLPEVNLWIAGAPVDAYWQNEIYRRGLSSRIKSWGKVSDLAPLYQSADLFVHPTLYDACANTVLQSMACGLPGVISSRDGARDFIRNGENGWLLEDPEDSEELAGKISRGLAANIETRIAARATMLPLTWEAHVNEWLRLIPKVNTENAK
jgi:glycosyltransferase involved in cell wall biosynthesis